MKKFKNYYSRFQKLTVYDIIVIFILIVFFIFLSTRNLLFSFPFELLGLREIDDYAFQITLRSAHQFLDRGQFSNLFAIVDYGYGNLFWFINAVITYPFYKMGQEAAVIIIPRFICQCLYILTGYYLFKVNSLINKKDYSAIFIMLMGLLVPAFIYAAQRFHTHAYLAFLGVFIFYLIFQERGVTPWGKAFFFTGIAIGLKMTGLFFAPFVGLSYLSEKDNFKLNKAFFKNVFWSFIGASLSLCPLILFAPIYWKECTHVVKII